MARLLLALAGALLAVGVGTADAHGPTRQKITETVDIAAPPEKVWAAVSNFQDMGWLPPVERTEGQGGNTPDQATRKLTLRDGGTIEESLAKYDPEKMMYMYRIEHVDVKVLPVTNYSSWLTVIPKEGGTSQVEWRGAFYRGYPNNDPPPELNDEAAVRAVRAVYRAGLDALRQRLEAGG